MTYLSIFVSLVFIIHILHGFNHVYMKKIYIFIMAPHIVKLYMLLNDINNF